MTARPPRPKRVSLFVTCLVDNFFPQVGIATVNLLERLGFAVDFPAEQVCCGQPAFNSGYPAEARKVARPLLDAFAASECVVCPSGSCTAMIRNHFPELFREDEALAAKATALAGKVYELSEFLVRVAGIVDTGSASSRTVVVHDACHLLRDLQGGDEPHRLLESVRGLKIASLRDAEECCGFGGTFAVKHSRLSTEMTLAKVEAIHESGADAVVSSDCGCLMNIAGALSRVGSRVEALHIAEVLEPVR